MNDIHHISFGVLLEFQHIGIPHKRFKNKIIFSKEEIQAEINRRLSIAENNFELKQFYHLLMRK